MEVVAPVYCNYQSVARNDSSAAKEVLYNCVGEEGAAALPKARSAAHFQALDPQTQSIALRQVAWADYSAYTCTPSSGEGMYTCAHKSAVAAAAVPVPFPGSSKPVKEEPVPPPAQAMAQATSAAPVKPLEPARLYTAHPSFDAKSMYLAFGDARPVAGCKEACVAERKTGPALVQGDKCYCTSADGSASVSALLLQPCRPGETDCIREHA